MKFSFIIPVYNCGKYLENCISNITAISYPDYEIVLVDDGSDDNSPEICDSFAGERVKVFHQENQGVSAARNKGISLAAGDYLIFIDADDSIDAEKMSVLLSLTDSYPELDMVVYGMSFDYYHKGECYRRDSLIPEMNGIFDASDWTQKIESLYLTNSLSSLCNKIFKRRILSENDLLLRRDMFLYEDLEFSLRCLAHCDKILFSDRVIYHYRQSEDEGNAGRRLKRIEHIPSLINKIDDAIKYMAQEQKIAEPDKIRQILVPLYLVLAREKNNVSDTEQIKTVCGDFAAWAENCGLILPKDNEYCNMLLNGQAVKIIARRTYTAIRHKIAVAAKSSGLYKR